MDLNKLKQEAEEYLKKKNYTGGYIGYFASGYCEQAYIDSAEPREKRIEELEKKIKSLEGNSSLHEGILWNDIHNQDKKIAELEAQIEKMKSDVKANIKWADEHKNNQMYCKLNAMFNQWEIKEK